MDNNLGKLLIAFVLLILGLSLIKPVADNVYANTHTDSVTNEGLTFTAGADTTTYDDLIGYTAIRNATNAARTGECNVTLSSGYVKCNATAFIGATGFIDYTYNPPMYVKNGTARSLLSLLNIFFALGVLSLSVALAYSALKDMGMIK